MRKVQTANSTYIHTGVGGILLKVGNLTPVLEDLTPWHHVGDPDHFTDYPRKGERWSVRGADGMRLSTSTVVQVVNYDEWCRRIDQPTYHLCTEHIFALAKHNDVRLSTSFHTDGDCDLCIAAHDEVERGLE